MTIYRHVGLLRCHDRYGSSEKNAARVQGKGEERSTLTEKGRKPHRQYKSQWACMHGPQMKLKSVDATPKLQCRNCQAKRLVVFQEEDRVVLKRIMKEIERTVEKKVEERRKKN